jgi:hypothetical protein
MPERGRAAQDLLDDIAARSELEPTMANVATTLVAAHLAAVLTDRRLADLRQRIGEFDELATEGRVHAAEISAGHAYGDGGTFAGRLFASVGELVGGDDDGPVSRTMVLIGRLGRIGLDVGDMRALASAMIAHVRGRLGDSYVDTMVAKARAHIPILGRYLA